MRQAKTPTPPDIIGFLDMCREIGVEPDLWECRNTHYDLHQDQTFYKALDPETREAFDNLGRRLAQQER